MIQMFNMVSNIYDKDVIPEIKLRDEVVSKKIYEKKRNKEVGRNALLSKVSKVWNTLPKKLSVRQI